MPREPRNKTVYGCYVASFSGLPRFYLCVDNNIWEQRTVLRQPCIIVNSNGGGLGCILSTCAHINLTHTPSHTHSPSHTHTPHPHSGGTNYTITGTGLDSVQQPRLLFYMDGAAGEGRTRRQTAGQNMNYIQSEVSMEYNTVHL